MGGVMGGDFYKQQNKHDLCSTPAKSCRTHPTVTCSTLFSEMGVQSHYLCCGVGLHLHHTALLGRHRRQGPNLGSVGPSNSHVGQEM